MTCSYCPNNQPGMHVNIYKSCYFYRFQSFSMTIASFILNYIAAPPKIVPFEFQADLLREGMRARLQCVVSEGDLPLNVTWLKDGEPILSNLGVLVRVLDEFSSILTISSIIPSHNGKYTCVATNRAATVMHSADLSVNGKHSVFFNFCSSSEGDTFRLS